MVLQVIIKEKKMVFIGKVLTSIYKFRNDTKKQKKNKKQKTKTLFYKHYI